MKTCEECNEPIQPAFNSYTLCSACYFRRATVYVVVEGSRTFGKWFLMTAGVLYAWKVVGISIWR